MSLNRSTPFWGVTAGVCLIALPAVSDACHRNTRCDYCPCAPVYSYCPYLPTCIDSAPAAKPAEKETDVERKERDAAPKETDVERGKSQTRQEGQDSVLLASSRFPVGKAGVLFASAAADDKEYCYACKINTGNGWETYKQTPWKSYCDQNDKDRMLDLRDQMKARGIPAKVVEKEREVN